MRPGGRRIEPMLLAVAASGLMMSCAAPTGTHLKQLQSDPSSRLLPPSSQVFASGKSDLRAGIDGKQRAYLSRQVVSVSACDTVTRFYSDSLTTTGWVVGSYGAPGSRLGDTQNLSWVKGPLSFSLAIESRAITGAEIPAGPDNVGGTAVRCTFRTEIDGS